MSAERKSSGTFAQAQKLKNTCGLGNPGKAGKQ